MEILTFTLDGLRSEVAGQLSQASSETLNALRRDLALFQEELLNLKRSVSDAYQAQVKREANDELLREKSPEELQALIDAAQKRISATVDDVGSMTPQFFEP